MLYKFCHYESTSIVIVTIQSKFLGFEKSCSLLIACYFFFSWNKIQSLKLLKQLLGNSNWWWFDRSWKIIGSIVNFILFEELPICDVLNFFWIYSKDIIRNDTSKKLQIDRYELRSLYKAGMNKVSVHLNNEPVSTGQRAIGARLLSPFENRHYCDQG